MCLCDCLPCTFFARRARSYTMLPSVLLSFRIPVQSCSATWGTNAQFSHFSCTDSMFAPSTLSSSRTIQVRSRVVTLVVPASNFSVVHRMCSTLLQQATQSLRAKFLTVSRIITSDAPTLDSPSCDQGRWGWLAIRRSRPHTHRGRLGGQRPAGRHTHAHRYAAHHAL